MEEIEREEEEKFEFEALLEKGKEELKQRVREHKEMVDGNPKAVKDRLEQIERLKREAVR